MYIKGAIRAGIFSGEPSLYPTVRGYLALFSWPDSGSPPVPGITDSSGNSDSFDSGCSSDNCRDVHKLVASALDSYLPVEGQYKYIARGGPNSNSLAHWLGKCSGFPNVTAPPNTVLPRDWGGWNYTLAIDCS
jgi:hypothetical protein